MQTPFESLAALNKLIHEPARLAIMTALSGVVEADFLYLEKLTGLTKGNLSTHLSKLEAAGLVQVAKQFAGRKPVTRVCLTEQGREAIDRYWTQLQELGSQSRGWQHPLSEP